MSGLMLSAPSLVDMMVARHRVESGDGGIDNVNVGGIDGHPRNVVPEVPDCDRTPSRGRIRTEAVTCSIYFP